MLELLNELYVDTALCARMIGLNYCDDQAAGWQRRRCGKGFRYLDSAGRSLRASAIKARIQALAIPPAWREVWISPDEDGHLQATGLDEAGRKQYRYHPRWQSFRNRLKYYHLLAFAESLPRIRRAVQRLLKSPDPFEQSAVLATMVLLLDKGALRIGNESYYEQNESIGLTTLQPEHLSISGQRFCLKYLGKSGQEQEICCEHKLLSERLGALKDQANERLFCYREQGQWKNIGAEAVNQFLQSQSPHPVSAKNFRTWRGTLMAFETMCVASQRGEKLPLKAIIEKVAETLGNTPAVAQSSYIHADLLDLWREGSFADYLQALPAPKRQACFSHQEQQLKALLGQLFEERFALPRQLAYNQARGLKSA